MFVHQALKYSSVIMFNFLFLTALEICNYESIIRKISQNWIHMPLYRYTERYCQHHGPSQDSAADISGPQHVSPESGRLPTLPNKDLNVLTGPVWQRGPVYHDVRTGVRAGSHLYYFSVSTGILYHKPSICSTLGSIIKVGWTLCTWKCLHGRNVHKFWIE